MALEGERIAKEGVSAERAATTGRGVAASGSPILMGGQRWPEKERGGGGSERGASRW